MSNQTNSDAIKPTFSLFATIGVVAGVALAIIKAVIRSKGAFTSEMFGYDLTGALIPGAIAYAIAGRRNVRNFNRFSLCFLLVSIVSLLMELEKR
jgi:hypothetical protein